MSDFSKIWKLECRRDRSIFHVLFPLEVLFTFLAWSGVFSTDIADFFSVMLIGGLLPLACFISTGGVIRDFQLGTMNLFFSLPMTSLKLFWGKYLYSLFVFLLICSCGIFLIYTQNSESGMFVGFPKFFPFKTLLVFLLMTHAVFFYWSLLLRTGSGPALAIFMLPVSVFAFAPAFSPLFFADIYFLNKTTVISSLHMEYLFLLLFLLFLPGACILWQRSIAVESSRWRIFWKQAVIYFVLPWLICAGFYTVRIAEYLNVLNQFESVPEFRIYHGKIRLPDFELHPDGGNESGKRVMRVLFEKRQREFPVERFEDYIAQRRTFFCRLNRYAAILAEQKKYDEIIEIIRHLSTFPDEVYPRMTFVSEHVSQVEESAADNKIDLLYMTSLTPDFYKILLNSLPLVKDSLPAVQAAIRELERSINRKRIFSVLPETSAAQGKRCISSPFVPGIGEKGSGRLWSVMKFIIQEKGYAMSFSVLAYPKSVLEHWLNGIDFFRKLGKMKNKKERVQLLERNLSLFPLGGGDSFDQVKENYFLLLPAFKLRKYYLEHDGELPDDPGVCLDKTAAIPARGDSRLSYAVISVTGNGTSIRNTANWKEADGLHLPGVGCIALKEMKIQKRIGKTENMK